MTDQSVEGRINQHLEEENRRLEATLELLRTAGQMDPEARRILSQIGQYLPQLTHMATNMSMVASAVTVVEQRIKESHVAQARANAKLGELVEQGTRQADALVSIAQSLSRIAGAAEGVEDESWRASLRST